MKYIGSEDFDEKNWDRTCESEPNAYPNERFAYSH
jgi:hypothetical protein